MTNSDKPRVFLVDDHELIRSGIRAEIAGSVDIIGEADAVGAAIEIILERSPAVVLLDVIFDGHSIPYFSPHGSRRPAQLHSTRGANPSLLRQGVRHIRAAGRAAAGRFAASGIDYHVLAAA